MPRKSAAQRHREAIAPLGAEGLRQRYGDGLSEHMREIAAKASHPKRRALPEDWTRCPRCGGIRNAKTGKAA